jgi:hypothetical protein
LGSLDRPSFAGNLQGSTSKVWAPKVDLVRGQKGQQVNF